MIRYAPILFLLLLLSPISLAAEDQPSAEKIVEQVMPAIVAIRADTPGGLAAGTGFLIDGTGLIVTNLHVIEGARRVGVKLHSGEQYSQVRIAAFDKERDLAILRIPGANLPTLNLGNSDGVRVGATVYAIGNPLGLEESVTMGIVSSIREWEHGTRVIQTDSAVSPGNSGGPLIDRSGSVIGVVTFKVEDGENINFAVPINYARALLSVQELLTLGEFTERVKESETSLFDPSASDTLSGTWTDVRMGHEIELSEEGDYLYGTYESEGQPGRYDLTKQSDGVYKGSIFYGWRCGWSGDANSPPWIKNCSIEREVELNVVTTNRMAGRELEFIEYKGDQARLAESCRTCAESERDNMRWEEIVWKRKK